MRHRIICIMAVLTVVGMFFSPSPSLPLVDGMPLASANITPNVTWDDFDDFGDYDTNCSLREALHSAMYNTDYGGCAHTGDWADDADRIILSAGTYNLSLTGYDDAGQVGDLDIFDAAAAAPRLVSPAPNAENPNITIQGAVVGSNINANDIDHAFEIMAGISVLIDNVLIYNGYPQVVTDCDGGAIYVEGTLKLTDSYIYGNRTMPGGIGGGIANNGSLTLNNVIIENNWTSSSTTDVSSGMGGGIYSNGDLYLVDVYIHDNNTGNNTGTGYVGGGGGINNIGDAYLNRVTIYDNYVGNATTHGGAGGGGILNNGQLTIHSSTISGNRSGGGGLGGNYDGGPGGGIYSSSAGVITIIDDSTIVNNWTGRSGGTGSSSGGGISVDSTDTTLKNTIVANNSAEESPDCDGGFISTGFNLVEDDDGCAITGAADTIIGQDPMLAPITDVGATGWMHRLYLNSPAIDAGPNTCLSHDQRHLLRPKDGNGDGTATCDIGAYEAYIWLFSPITWKP